MNRRQASEPGIQGLLCIFKWQSHYLPVIWFWASSSLTIKAEIFITTLKDLSFIVVSVCFLLSSSSTCLLYFSYFCSILIRFLSLISYLPPLLFLSLFTIFSEFFLKLPLSCKYHLTLISQLLTWVPSKNSGPKVTAPLPWHCCAMGLPSSCRTFMLMEHGPEFAVPEYI